MQARNDERAVVIVPVAPILTLLIAVYASMLDVGLVVARLISNGNYPSPIKIAVCSVILAAATIYHLRWGRNHREQREAIRLLSEQGSFRPGINGKQAAMVIAVVMGATFLGAWAFYV